MNDNEPIDIEQALRQAGLLADINPLTTKAQDHYDSLSPDQQDRLGALLHTAHTLVDLLVGFQYYSKGREFAMLRMVVHAFIVAYELGEQQDFLQEVADFLDEQTDGVDAETQAFIDFGALGDMEWEDGDGPEDDG